MRLPVWPLLILLALGPATAMQVAAWTAMIGDAAVRGAPAQGMRRIVAGERCGLCTLAGALREREQPPALAPVQRWEALVAPSPGVESASPSTVAPPPPANRRVRGRRSAPEPPVPI